MFKLHCRFILPVNTFNNSSDSLPMNRLFKQLLIYLVLILIIIFYALIALIIQDTNFKLPVLKLASSLNCSTLFPYTMDASRNDVRVFTCCLGLPRTPVLHRGLDLLRGVHRWRELGGKVIGKHGGWKSNSEPLLHLECVK